MAEVTVSSEAVAEHLPRVARLARKYNGSEGAEFDDLYQEGSIAVLLALQEDREPYQHEINEAMIQYIRKCRRWRRQESMSEEALDTATGIHSDPGRRKTFWVDEDGTMKGGWSELFYAPK